MDFLGITTIIFSTLGFFAAKRLYKFLMLLFLLIVLLIASNNVSPLYNLLLSQDWYVLQRVSTRIWFIPLILALILFAYALERVIKNRSLILLIVIITLIENIFTSWFIINKPIKVDNERFVSREILEFLKTDNNKFRVFCTTRCISQKDAAIYRLELTEGYNTLQQKNYYDQFIQLSQIFWDKYTLSLPPFEIFTFREIQPYSPEIADYNIKYVISPYYLKDVNLQLKFKSGKYLVYENNIFKSRAYFSNNKEAPILEYLPNYIKVDTSSKVTSQLILSEVYSPGWKAKLDDKQEVAIVQTPGKLRQVDLNDDTKFVVFYYQPNSYQIGKTVSLICLLLILIIYLSRRKISFHHSSK